MGIDGAGWNVVRPLARRGGLPHLAKLLEEGAAGDLKSLPARPVNRSNSAAIWTSIATGKPPELHGISDFVYRDPSSGRERFHTSATRKTKAFWNILSERGLRVGVVGWWVTWPAEAVRGAMIAYDFWPARRAAGADCPGCPAGGAAVRPDPRSAHPAELVGRFEPLIVRERSLADAEALSVHEGPGYGNEDYWAYARDETMARAAEELLKGGDYDAFAVYFESPDIASHRWWFAREGENFWGIVVPERQRERLGRRVDRYYAFVDSKLGRLREAAGAGAVVMVISDHGYETYADLRALERRLKRRLDELSPEERARHGVDRLQPAGHSGSGILALAGPGVRRGAEAPRGSIYDVLPTLLRLLGLPPARDMRGRALEELLNGAPPAVATVDTYESPRSAAQSDAGDPPPGLEERLRSLGYLK